MKFETVKGIELGSQREKVFALNDEFRDYSSTPYN